MSKTPAIVSKVEQEHQGDIVVCSYNILLPNHSNWWVFKYYQSDIREKFSSWRYRKKILRKQFAEIDADLLAVQETFPETFEDDFDFILEDYEGVCHRKSNIACALFWKRGRFIPLTIRQRDRSIVAILQDGDRIIAFTSCHLNAGQQPKRRFQQVFAICQQLRKETQRYDIDLFVIAGDFNATGNQTAVQELLTCGVVDPDFREDKYPLEEITSNRKEQSIGKFTDIYSSIGDFPTMEVLNARDRIIDWEKQELRQSYTQALKLIFDQFAEAGKMQLQGVEAWAMRINQGLRGGEYRKGVILAQEDKLDFQAFLSLHKDEAILGKSWSLYADLQAFGLSLPIIGEKSNKFVLDRIWYRSDRYRCTQARQPISPLEQELIDQGDYTPNSWHPSDHFPLVVRFSRLKA